MDYLVTSTFHQMVVKAVAQVLSALQHRGCQSPSQSRSRSDPAEVSRTAAHAEISLNHTHTHTESQFEQLFGSAWCFSFKCLVAETSGDPSMFTTELVLDIKALTYDPSEDKFQVSTHIANSCLYFICPNSWFSLQVSFLEIFGQMKQTVKEVGTLTQDPDFDLITEFQEDRVGGHSTSTVLCCDVAVISNIVCVHVRVCVFRR